MYVPFFRAKYSSFVFQWRQQPVPYPDQKVCLRDLFFSVLICEEEIERPLTLYRGSASGAVSFFGISDTSVSTAQFVFLMTGEHQQCPGLFLHFKHALCRQVFADIFVQCYGIL